MGTSTSYSASVKGQPQWGKLSGIVTSTCGSVKAKESNLQKILGRYVNVIGGASKAGSGKSKIGGRASLRTANKLGSFIGTFISTSGNIEEALSQTGLTDLSRRSVSEIVNYLIEYCSGPSSIIDDSAAKEASRILLEELIGNAKTLEEMKERLLSNLKGITIEEVIIKYYGHYVYGHLSKMFYEKLIKEKGKSACGSLFKQIKTFIFIQLSKMNKKNSLNKIKLGSEKAKNIIAKIQTDVLKVFENYEN
jgi:hypothetical protein